MKTPHQSQITASLFPLPDQLEPGQIRSATQYIIIDHLVRNLIRYSSVGQLEGDLAESWKFDSEFKKFDFVLKPGIKFSDGTPILASHLVDTMSRQIKAKTSIHFNFQELQNVRTLSTNSLQIELKKSNPNFLLQLLHPEFGVLSPKDLTQAAGKVQFNTSSGAYRLVSFERGRCILEKNPYFLGSVPNSPERVVFEDLTENEKIDSLGKGNLDLAIPLQAIAFSELKKQAAEKNFLISTPHIGFTYWISINPRSALFAKKEIRNRFQTLIQNKVSSSLPNNDIPWARADQLYLPDGLGRPDSTQLAKVWTEIAAQGKNAELPKKIRFLTSSKFPFNKLIEEAVSGAGSNLETVTYSNQDEFATKQKAENFDLFLNDNDFSSLDVFENLQVTFNPVRPLVMLPLGSPIVGYLEKSSKMPPSLERHALFKTIALELLSEGLIAPVAYNRIVFLHRKELDVSAWSQLFPEISFWKSRLQK